MDLKCITHSFLLNAFFCLVLLFICTLLLGSKLSNKDQSTIYSKSAINVDRSFLEDDSFSYAGEEYSKLLQKEVE